ncbi:DUF5305 family protein [Clostridium sp.]|uniref:DUF5305 family protein n=1 Tax=Clostridium sp. TaxID=1506 RepID=UPI003D6D6FA2
MFYISKRLRNSTLALLMMIIIILIGLTVDTVFFKKDKVVMKNIYGYSYEAGLDYQVYLSPNSIYGSLDFLPSGKMYMLPYTDYINIIYTNKFIGEKSASIYYSYNIYAEIESTIGVGEDKKILWSKEETLLSKTTSKIKEKTLSINDSITININKYTSYVKSLYKDMNIDATNNLLIRMEGKLFIEYEGQTVIKDFNPKLSIPLNKNIYEINKENNVLKSEFVQKQSINKQSKTDKLVILIIGVVIFIVLLFLLLFKTKQKKDIDAFDKNVSNIFKEYGNRLAGLDSSLPYQAAVIITVNSIKDMIKIADEIGQPVFYYRANENDERKIEFYVFNETRLYYMVMFGTMGNS